MAWQRVELEYIQILVDPPLADTLLGRDYVSAAVSAAA